MHCPDAPSGENGILLQLREFCWQGSSDVHPGSNCLRPKKKKILLYNIMSPSWGNGTSNMQFICGLKLEFSIPCLHCSEELPLCWNFMRCPLRCFLYFFFYSSIYYHWVHVCLVYLRLWVSETSEENFLGLVLSFHCGFQKPNSCFQSWATSALTWCAMSRASPEVHLGFNPLLGSVLSSPPFHGSPRPHFIFLLFSIPSQVCFTGNPPGNRENASSDPREIRISKPWPVAVFTLCRYGLLGHSHTCSFTYPL